ncbi:alpha-glucosidase family protein [Sphingobium sp. JS3065]|uniref:alpha-glucosidase n=1 Tax=Sphingobium sp. JS3065 TaxID=2970925 RepID=UPI002264EFC7|nr:alpha-glucosidase [Sphingobium sp. JS3065]UZW55381.1 alpha-glucosidase family protein [Sphingobium sp. JS3065]
MTDTPLPWWRGAAIYQIYPRSFADSNGDGIGDLKGITAHLPYVASLGVDAIWLSPFFKSPMRDFGYDVSDYCDVDPIFGTLEDFDALVARAHGLGLRIIVDQVWAHTSDEHRWFIESRSSRDNPKADWYVWADPKPDGSPPNNWQSVFGGPAWTWDARRGQYYMHQFLAQQPQLHLHRPDVQDSVFDIIRFWLDRGVDGFRIDAINHSMHDPRLRDNPPAPDDGKARTRPFDFQIKKYSQSHPDIPLFLEKVRQVFDEYRDRFTVAEVGGAESEREMKSFTQGDSRLNTAYGFDFLYAPELTAEFLKAALVKWPAETHAGWPSWAFENHDAPRAVSRWAKGKDADAYCRMKMLLLACLRGNIFLYYGEELGLPQVDIAFEDLQDPEAIANWPLTLSRDGARTPMPWRSDAPYLGFSEAKPWLPVGEAHRALAVDVQEARPDSLLHWTRRVLALRNGSPALRVGAMDFLETPEELLAFERVHEGERLLCVFNLGEKPVTWKPDDHWNILLSTGGVEAWRFPAKGACVSTSGPPGPHLRQP